MNSGRELEDYIIFSGTYWGFFCASAANIISGEFLSVHTISLIFQLFIWYLSPLSHKYAIGQKTYNKQGLLRCQTQILQDISGNSVRYSCIAYFVEILGCSDGLNLKYINCTNHISLCSEPLKNITLLPLCLFNTSFKNYLIK